jgi:hypothetical protein
MTESSQPKNPLPGDLLDEPVRIYWKCPCGLGGVVDNVRDDYTEKLGAMYDQHRSMTIGLSSMCGGGHASIRETIRMADLILANAK